AEILVQEGVTAKVGAKLAVIRESGSAAVGLDSGSLASAVTSDGAGAQRLSPTAEHAAEIAKPPSVPKAGGQAQLSPVVRKLIAEHGIEPGRIRGTGRDGRITREDVTAYISQAEAKRPRPAPSTSRTPETPAERIAPAAPAGQAL